ncbi:ParB/RepB/Spo0J family partition protein [Salmonella enterica]|uniref:ParB family protein n=1 Tax=Citrobacter braakii TaxID=57706 RepID=UPI00142A2C9E|nr:ParB family protein [Citrobacter braakii]ECX2001744.1 ParB/RepB/Spo0J family partition protein [Salmonella enterica subsp. enterica serovar Newport]EDT9866661.1 ParB/RepB/Spo0J family partition protein [Salmonella enterica]EJH1760477.1 ParB/RepB/Spo0J family partition protein [Escherichia coli]EIX5024876.1 ParB/RepB/Spo0J family partition protein [Salmonella enterica]ELK6843013.1 ParB/RepB/Spo0J family partition protein [Citrobacter braakii]
MSNKKLRPVVGRVLGQAMLSDNDPSSADSAQQMQVFTLSTGRQATFVEITIPPGSVESDTFVVQENNGRDQSALTPESLKNITRTMKFQQFYPTIGVRREGKIEILDGSRRRASAILCKVGLRILITEQDISVTEAQRLAKDLQTSVEHNIREIGLRLMNLKNNGMSQKEIAASEGMSQAKVTRALQAASAPEDLIALFPVQSELTYSDYKQLCVVADEMGNKDLTLNELVSNISNEVDKVQADEELAEDEVKNQIMKLITKEAQILTVKGPKDKAVVSELWKFEERHRYARKRVKDRVVSYEFSRIPRELQDELDRMINHLLKKNLSKSEN